MPSLTRDQRDARIGEVVEWLQTHDPALPIRIDEVVVKYAVGRRTAARYLEEAQNLIRIAVRGDVDDLRAQSMNVYNGIIYGRGIPPSIRLAAQRQKDILLGLNMPARIVVEGSVALRVDVEKQAAFLKSAEAIQAAARLDDMIASRSQLPPPPSQN